jgi:hypothetical protein
MKSVFLNLTITVVSLLILGLGCCKHEPPKMVRNEAAPVATGSTSQVERNRQIELGMKADAIEQMTRYNHYYPLDHEPTLPTKTDYPTNYPTTYPRTAPAGGD